MKSILFQVAGMLAWFRTEICMKKNIEEKNVFEVQNALIKWYFQRHIVYVHRC